MVVVCFADTIKIAPSVEKLMEIHSHEGRTRFHWQDWPEEPKAPAMCECGHDESFHQSRGAQCDYGSGSDLVKRVESECKCWSFRPQGRTWHQGVPPLADGEEALYLVRRGSEYQPRVIGYLGGDVWRGDGHEWSLLRV
jgi:hypothetical protein